jgi:hypothetical protein
MSRTPLSHGQGKIPANHQPLALLVGLRLRKDTGETKCEIPESWVHLNEYGTTHAQFAYDTGAGWSLLEIAPAELMFHVLRFLETRS